jgi:hypothetical protein
MKVGRCSAASSLQSTGAIGSRLGPVRQKWTVGLFRWLVRLSLAVVGLLALAVAVVNNNVSLSALSRVDFANSLDRSLGASADWTANQFSSNASGELIATDLGMEFVTNPALLHMLVDSSTISGDLRLRDLTSKIVAAYRQGQPGLIAKLVDPTIDGSPRSRAELEEYQRWFLYGLSPAASPLSAAELADMFSTDKFRMYDATHQLFALYLYRKFNGDTPELSRLMGRLEGRIAAEAALDFRVSDLYQQRIAFLLAAGRPDFVKPRWVERALAAQQSDGGWLYSWHGWGPHMFGYTFADAHSLAHPTAQGMWLTNMLKYRYPDWIEKNYR